MSLYFVKRGKIYMFKNICKIFCFLFITITFLVLPTSKSIATDDYQVLFFTSYDSDNTIFNKHYINSNAGYICWGNYILGNRLSKKWKRFAKRLKNT